MVRSAIFILPSSELHNFRSSESLIVIPLPKFFANCILKIPTVMFKKVIYQLIENLDDEAWELHITDIE